MELQHLQADYNKLQMRFVASAVIAAISIVTNFALAMTISLQSEPPTVLVPAGLSAETHITVNGQSDSYVADLAHEIAITLLNTTPSNLTFRREALLRVTHPAAHGDVAAQLDDEATRIVKSKTSSVFHPSAVDIVERGETPKAVVGGTLVTLIGKTRVSTETIKVRLAFARDARGALLLGSAQQLKEKDDG